MRLILSRGFPAVYHDVHVLAACHVPYGVGEAHGHLEQVHADVLRHVEQRFVVVARHDEHVTVVDRLDVHEGDGVRILVTDRDLRRALDKIAKRTVRGRVAWPGGVLLMGVHTGLKRTDNATAWRLQRGWAAAETRGDARTPSAAPRYAARLA